MGACMRKYKYVVVSYPADNGGNIALNTLANCLKQLGESIDIIYWRPNANAEKYSKLSDIFYFFKINISYDLKIMIFNCFNKWVKNHHKFKIVTLNKKIRKIHRKMFPVVSNNTIVIYPDVYYGNPLNAKKVVRWLLYYNRFKDDVSAYGIDDLFFCFREQFNDYKLNPQRRELYLPYFDLDLYKRTNWGERSGKCYIIRKGRFRNDIPATIDGIVVDNLSEEEKVATFNKCEYCISYDTQTAYSAIAAMCGCKSIVVPEVGKTREDYLTSEDIERGVGDGVAYGFSDDELRYAEQTRDNIFERYKKINENALKQTKEFVEECTLYFS